MVRCCCPSEMNTAAPLLAATRTHRGREMGSYRRQQVGFSVGHTEQVDTLFLIHCGILLGRGFTCRVGRRLQTSKTWAQNSGSLMGPLRSQKMPFVTLLLNKKNYKKVRKHQRHISPQVSTEKAHVSRPFEVAPRRRGLDWARPASHT